MFTSVLPGIWDLGPPGAPWMVCVGQFDGSIGIRTETTIDWVYIFLSERFQWPLYNQVYHPIKPCLRRFDQVFGIWGPRGPLGWFVLVILMVPSASPLRPLPIGYICCYLKDLNGLCIIKLITH